MNEATNGGDLVPSGSKQPALKLQSEASLLRLVERANQSLAEAAGLPLEIQIEKLNDQRALLDSIARIAKTRNFQLQTGNYAAESRLHAEATLGELLEKHCRHGGDRRSAESGSTETNSNRDKESRSRPSILKLQDFGVSRDDSPHFRRVAQNRHLITAYCSHANEQNVEITTRRFLVWVEPPADTTGSDPAEDNAKAQELWKNKNGLGDWISSRSARVDTESESANDNDCFAAKPTSNGGNGKGKSSAKEKSARSHTSGTITAEEKEPNQKEKDSDDYLTPRHVANFVQKLLYGDITVDPCASLLAEQHGHSTVNAEHRYTINDDGLTAPWFGSVYINPPYSNVEPWVNRVLDELAAGTVTAIAMLVNVCSDAKWYAKLREFPRVYIRRRLQFIEPSTGEPAKYTARAPSVLVYSDRDKIDWFAGLASRELGDVFQLYKAYDPPPSPTIDSDDYGPDHSNRTTNNRRTCL